jgi:hypothetical protein
MAKKSGMNARFEAATLDTRRYRTILRVIGEKGTGKTRLGLTAPGPTLYQSFDDGLEGVIEKFLEGDEDNGIAARTDLYVRQYKWHPGGKDAKGSDGEFNQEYAQSLRDEFEEDLAFALENGVRTVVWDKETDIWEMYRYAEFGGPSDAPKDYPALNQRYMAAVNSVKGYNANLILIQGMKEEWVTKKRTKASGQVVDTPGPSGKRVPSGFGRLDELVFAELMCHREGTDFYFDFRADFDAEFGKCRQNASLCGERISARTFAELGTLLIEGSDESDWA